MLLFHFVLNTGSHSYRDVDGGEFPDEAAARAHGRLVACELMRNREAKARHWRLEVRNASGEIVDQIVFALLDDVLNAQPPKIRAGVEQFYRSTGSLIDAMGDLRTSIRQVRATLARASKAPYLASVDGKTL